MSFGAQFLTTGPEPLLSQKQGWGEVSRDIHLPFGTCHFDHLTEVQHAALDTLDIQDRPLCEAHVSIDVRLADPRAFRTIEWNGRDYELEFEYRPDRVSWAGDGFFVELETGDDPCACRLWTRVNDSAQFAGVTQNVLRIVAAYRLLSVGGLLLHSAAVVPKKAALLFYGISGAGKSTIAASGLAQGFTLFSDDLNALVPTRDGFVVAAVPFTGDLDHATGALEPSPVDTLYQIRQSTENTATELPGSRAVASLAVCSPFVNVDPHRQAPLLDVLTRLAARVPPKTLLFRKPVDFWGELSDLE
jgi:hypothetical protein